MKKTTIFNQLVFNVVIPALVALIILGGVNYQNLKSIMVDNNKKKNESIANQIKSTLEFQDMSLETIESSLDSRMKMISNEIITNHLKNTSNIDKIDLNALRTHLGMDSTLEDLYIINKDGIVVNTTFDKDKGLNLYSFGKEHENYLKEVFHGGKFISERFATEASTKQIKKYTYQPTVDGKYILEIGAYSNKANEIVEFIVNRLKTLCVEDGTLKVAELFIITDNPFSLSQKTTLSKEERPLIDSVCKTEKQLVIRGVVDGKTYDYDYIYMPRKNSALYKGAVIKLVSDKSNEISILRNELIKLFIIFSIAIIVVVVMVYKKTKVITSPIKNLVDSVNRITNGHFNERAAIIGNNEIATLSTQFNHMISELESLYNDLEQKVKDRTAEIMAQKEEIEAQRDSIQEQRNMLEEVNKSLSSAYEEIRQQKKHVTDSIVYAKRIQTAILPSEDYVKSLLPESFIFYQPKDIVSGDFYWLNQKENIVMIAAVDCTGHGVPGAFMSIVGHNNLNQAVNIKGARNASDILNELNTGVKESLSSNENNDTVKDGMDIALCCFDFNKKILQFAGANNPLLLIRDNEAIMYDPTKAPIGNYAVKGPVVFANNEITIQKGDCCYIFSDGYADQFGGTDGRKFMKKRLKELLLLNHSLPMNEQMNILQQEHIAWRGENDQVDDILVIGIRV